MNFNLEMLPKIDEKFWLLTDPDKVNISLDEDDFFKIKEYIVLDGLGSMVIIHFVDVLASHVAQKTIPFGLGINLKKMAGPFGWPTTFENAKAIMRHFEIEWGENPDGPCSLCSDVGAIANFNFYTQCPCGKKPTMNGKHLTGSRWLASEIDFGRKK